MLIYYPERHHENTPRVLLSLAFGICTMRNFLAQTDSEGGFSEPPPFFTDQRNNFGQSDGRKNNR